MTIEFDKDILDEFVSESKEHLETIEDDFLDLEKQKNNPDPDLVNKVFRAIHTIKGSAGFLDLTNIQNLAHVMETLLSKMRNGEIKPEQEFIDPLLKGSDAITAMIDNIENSNEMDVSEVYDKLSALLYDETSEKEEKDISKKDEKVKKKTNIPKKRKFASKCKKQKVSKVQSGVATQKEHGLSIPHGQNQSDICDHEQLVSCDSGKTNKKRETKPAPKSSPDGDRNSTIRINIDILDELMRLAGELVLVRNQQLINFDKSDSRSRPIVQRLDIVTSELQETIMRTRMQPIGNVFNKFTRIVRDLGNKLGKQIELSITGNEVELDKTILESLADPLTHLVRNCCDHGIESGKDRLKAGKTEVGHIWLKAYHEGGQINIEIKDDGKGINIEAIKQKVLEKNLKTETELANMSEKEIQSLIMLPGFSTAEKVSDVSGRGVGMDVVKSNIERLGGTIDIESTFGEASEIHLRLPLTLAIIPCLMVIVGGHRYAIPQINVDELVSLYDDEIKTKIECVGDREVYRLRDNLLSLIRMDELLKRATPFTEKVRSAITEKYQKLRNNTRPAIAESKNDINKNDKRPNEERKFDLDDSLDKGVTRENPNNHPHKSHSLNFAVLKIGVNRFGLIVDSVLGTEEIVVKPMHPALKSLGCYSGATVMGDGKVALILDLDGVARHAGIGLDGRNAEIVDDEVKDREKQSVLLFKSGEKEQFAVALPLIRRIEHVKKSQIEQIGDKSFITVDGVSTLLARLNYYLNVSPCVESDEMFLLLPKYIKKPFGILMSSLVDISETSLELNEVSHVEEGLLGTSIVNGHVTLFIDLYKLVEKIDPAWCVEQTKKQSKETRKRILLAEDAVFFRQLIKGYLETDGYEVDTAKNGEEGIERFNSKEFDLIVSDIEMPVMNGLDFIKNVRKGNVRNNVPAVAMTSLDSDKDRENAMLCGFTRYETKFNRESFLTAISDVLESN